MKYRVTICTGNISGSGTDASVYLNIIGDLGDTGERLMFMSKNNVNKFEKGNVSNYIGHPGENFYNSINYISLYLYKHTTFIAKSRHILQNNY